MTAGWTWIYWEAPGALLPFTAALVERETGSVERLVHAASPAERDAAIADADTQRLTGAIRAWLAMQEAA